MNVSNNAKVLTDAYYWLSMYKSGAVSEDIALERVKGALFDQPQLNDNQQIVLEWLKECYRQGWGATIIKAIYLLYKENAIVNNGSSYIREAYRKLNTFEEATVVKLFAEWVLEQEDE